MKKGTIILIAVIAVIAIIALSLIGTYNGIVTKREAVDTAYSNIETQLQRRADLIPNLVNTVKGFTDHENEIIEKVTKARENLLKANTVAEKAEANQELSNQLRALAVIVENYPDLKSSENFINLQDELAGTENRIATARRDYNNAVKSYNTAIVTFPNSIVAGMSGMSKAEYFEATAGSEQAPVVDFN